MPNFPPPAEGFLGNWLKQLKQQLGGLVAGGTSYVVDPSILGPSPENPNCRLILGNVSVDNFGNGTGLPSAGRSKWGIAVYNTSTQRWEQP